MPTLTLPERMTAPAVGRGYRPAIRGAALSLIAGDSWFALSDADLMRRDPQVQLGLKVLRAPLGTLGGQILGNPPPACAVMIGKTMGRLWRSLRRLLAMLEYGVTIGEVCYVENLDKDLGKTVVEYDEFLHYHPSDCRPLEYTNGRWKSKIAGFRLTQMANDAEPDNPDSFTELLEGKNWTADAHNIVGPKALWVAHQAEFQDHWGRPRLADAYLPWAEKRLKHGAVDIRRSWYVRGAFSGGVMRYPFGSTMLPDGTTFNNEDIARQILEQYQTGGILTLPSTRDQESKEYLWVYEPPTINGELSDVREYSKDLDQEILRGLGVPPELVDAATVGSGYSGRAIPAQMMFASLDEVVGELLDGLDKTIIRPLVDVNFGRDVEYHLKADSLLEKISQQPADGQTNPMQAALDAAGGKAPDSPDDPGLMMSRWAAPARLSLPVRLLRDEYSRKLSARVRALADADYPEPEGVSLSRTPTRQAGHWITIGAKAGADGKRHGGTPVYIENGRITKGAPGLHGKKIAALKEDADTTHRQELHAAKGHSRAVHAKTARKEGYDPGDLHQLAAEMLAHHNENAAQTTKLLQRARQLQAGPDRTNLNALAANLRHGRIDHSMVKGFDQTADELHAQFPGMLRSDDKAGHLWEMLSAGNPEPMAEDDAYGEAMDYMRRHMEPRGKAKKEKEVDFDFGANDGGPPPAQ